MKSPTPNFQSHQNQDVSWHASLKSCFEVNINSSKLNNLISHIMDKVTIHESKINAISEKLNVSNDMLNKKIMALNMDFTQQLQISKKKIAEDLHHQNLLITENDRMFQDKDKQSNNKLSQLVFKVQSLKKFDLMIAQEINRINLSLFGSPNANILTRQQGLNQEKQQRDEFSILKFGKTISSNISQKKPKPLSELLQQLGKRFTQSEKNMQGQLDALKKQLRESQQSQEQTQSKDQQTNSHQLAKKNRRANTKRQKMLIQFAEKLDSLQYRVKDHNNSGIDSPRSRFDSRKGPRKSKLKRNGAFLRVSGYLKNQSQDQQDDFVVFDKKIASLSEFLKGSIKQLQNEIDIIKNKCIVNDEKNGFVMRKVEKFHLQNIELKNMIKKLEQSKIDDRDIQSLKTQFKMYMKQVNGFIQGKMDKEEFSRERQKLYSKIEILHQNLVEKADKGQIRKGFTFFEQKIKELILVVAQNQNFDQNGAGKRSQIKCLSCDKELERRMKALNLHNRTCNEKSLNKDLSLRTKTQNIRKRMKVIPNTITQVDSDG